MPTLPWKNYIKPEPERNYLIMRSYLPLKHSWRIPQFFRHVLRIQKQLDTTKGVIGYSLLAELLHNRFVKTKPHAETMSKIHSHMENPKFITWTAKGSTIPPNWADAKKQFAAKTP
jgi:hypothetical protein